MSLHYATSKDKIGTSSTETSYGESRNKTRPCTTDIEPVWTTPSEMDDFGRSISNAVITTSCTSEQSCRGGSVLVEDVIHKKDFIEISTISQPQEVQDDNKDSVRGV